MRDFVQHMVLTIQNASIGYFLVGNLIYVLIITLSFFRSRRRYLWADADLIYRFVAMRKLTPISVLIPCYNEEKSIVESVRSMLCLDYPDFELVVCNDGSKDATLAILLETFECEAVDIQPPMQLATGQVRQVYRSRSQKNLLVIDKVNGGKADALNACVNHCRHPLVCCVDSDSVLRSDSLARIATPFLAEPEETIAVGGTISIIGNVETMQDLTTPDFKANIPGTFLGMVQAIEYLRAFLVGRMGWDALDCTTIISGAFGLFKKSMVIKVGGYTKGSIGEDMELLLRMHAYSRMHNERYRVHFLPDPVCWTETPSDFDTLGKQRSRWQQGLCDSLWRNRSLFFHPKGGILSWFALPYLLFFELLSAPIEVMCYLLLIAGFASGLSEVRHTIVLFVITVVFGTTLNLTAIITDQITFYRYPRFGDIMKLIAGSFLEQVGFRYLHLWWRIRGIYRWTRGSHNWGDMKRRGLKVTPAPAASRVA